jgi:Rrf2 family nitric oxide-sensitive transcriptional repressor
MQLTTHSDYALRLLIYLASHSTRKVTTREIASAYCISLNHLTKVAKALTRAGWLVAARGSGGGLMLAPHTLQVRVGEIVRFTEYTCEVVECFDVKANTCPITNVCRLKPLLYRARKAFFDVLDAMTVQEMTRNHLELNAVFEQPLPKPRAARNGARRK